MPVITKLPFDPRVISLSVERKAVRSNGTHLSSILKDMLITAGVGRSYKGRPMTPEEQHVLFETGFLWERMVAEYIASPENKQIEWDRFATQAAQAQTEVDVERSSDLVRPGECLMDGVYMTPDALNVRHWHMEEWKATAIRSKDFSIEERRLEWLWQGAAYARYFKTNRVIYRVWHYQIPQDVSQFVVEWGDEEIEQNWCNVVQHKLVMDTRKK